MLGVGKEIFIEIDNIDRLNFSAVGEGGNSRRCSHIKHREVVVSDISYEKRMRL